MKVALFNAEKTLCADCSLALRRFIGGMEGVDSIQAERGKIAIKFNETEIDEEKIKKITKNSIERLGYGLEE